MTYEDYKHPVAKDDKNASHKEIYSHSSMLTNARLDDVFKGLMSAKTKAWINPSNLEGINVYFSMLYTLFDEIYPILEPNHNKEIMKSFEDYFRKYFEMIKNKQTSLKACYILLNYLNKIDRIIKGDLQKKQYFFKIGEKEVKGVEESIRIVSSGGGFFGGG